MGARPRFRNVLAHVRAIRPDISDPITAIQERRLLVGGVFILDTAAQVRSDAGVTVRARSTLRGSVKLEAALDRFGVDVVDAVCLDLGAAAGGFTRVLLQRGARLVYALDAGFGQLRGELRSDPRVVNFERTNLADAARIVPPEPPLGLVTADLSYLSLADALPQLEMMPIVRSTQLIALVKPMFELRRSHPPIDEVSLVAAVETAQRGAAAAGWRSVGWMPSPVAGATGAPEFLIYGSREETSW